MDARASEQGVDSNCGSSRSCRGTGVKEWIYFARFGARGPIKIGRTGYQPRDRVRNLSCTSPVEVFLIGAMVTKRAVEEEYEIHARLRPFRVRGEWFEAKAALQEMRRLGRRILPLEMLKPKKPKTSLAGKYHQFVFGVPKRIYDAVKRSAHDRQISMSAVVVEIIAKGSEAKKRRSGQSGRR